MSADNNENKMIVDSMIESAIKISLLAAMVVWCFEIIKPFITLVLWGGILAIALFPLFQILKNRLNGGHVLTSTLIAAPLLLVIIVPMGFITDSIIESTSSLVEQYKEGSLAIPAPSEKVAEWPLIGEKVYGFWSDLSNDAEATAQKFKPQIKEFGSFLLKTSASTGMTMLLFIASILLAAFFMTQADAIKGFFIKFMDRLYEEKGDQFVGLSIATIRSVAQGVIGIAFIQALLAAPALLLMGIPAAGLIILGVLVVAIVQIPTILILGPVMAYSFSIGDAVSATIFTIYLLLVGLSDNVLKPLLLGRGVDVPMLVILLGAIGGMLLSGIIGLFTGAVVLAMGYTIFNVWVNGVDSVEAARKDKAS